MLILMLMFSTMIIILILLIFYMSSKIYNFNLMETSSFECGYNSYFFSRYVFSMHYFIIGLIFLFLDLELCFIMPYFNGDFPSLISYSEVVIFISILIVSLLYEWKNKKLEWKF